MYLRSYITNKTTCACAVAKSDDQGEGKINPLAFVNFLFVKIFPTLIHQNFHHQNFVPYGNLYFGLANLCL